MSVIVSPALLVVARSPTQQLLRNLFDNSFAGIHQLAWFDWAMLIPYFTVLAILSLWLLYRYYRVRDPFFWMLTSSGVLLTASWLVLSLAQGYYSMMLFPFLMTVVLRNSVLRNWPSWLAVYGFLTMDRWLMWRWPTTGRFLEYMKVTYGWSLLLIVVLTVLYFRYLDAKSENRLDDGIDPLWVTADRPRASVD